MKKIISTCIALMVSAACSISAFAMEVPTNTTIQDLNGVRQYITVPISGECLVKKGKSYRLVLTWSINGVAQANQSVTKTCPYRGMLLVQDKTQK